LHTTNPFPKRLKEARLSAKLSQRDLGIKIGFEPSSASSRMNHYERGRHIPDYSIIKLIAHELRVPPWYFFCDSDDDAKRIIRLNLLDEHEIKQLDETLEMLLSK